MAGSALASPISTPTPLVRISSGMNTATDIHAKARASALGWSGPERNVPRKSLADAPGARSALAPATRAQLRLLNGSGRAAASLARE